ncbi:hypothetical protein CHS0354_020032, partial [Potamilus streckersoni]
MARRVSSNPNFNDILRNLAADTNGLLDEGRKAVELNINRLHQCLQQDIESY